jgi:hypothetical protein
MSNHFTGLNLGPPEGDTRLDLTDLYAFQAPADPGRTVLILNCNSFAKGADFHPDAVYRLNIDNDGDLQTDLAFFWTFSQPKGGRQQVTIRLAKGAAARGDEPAGETLVQDAEVTFGAQPNIIQAGPYTFFAGLRSDAFFIDFAGILNMFDHKGGKNFTGLEGKPSPDRWTGSDLFARQNVFSMAMELPTSLLGAKPKIRIWGRVSIRRNGTLVPVDRSGHPTLANFFMTDKTKPEFNRSEPSQDRQKFMAEFVHTLEHVGEYTPAEAAALIDREAILPDMLTYDPAKPAGYPNGRLRTDHVVKHRLEMLTNHRIPPDGLKPHDDLLDGFPYLGNPHRTPDPPPA